MSKQNTITKQRLFAIDTIETIRIDPTSFCNLRCPQCGRFDLKNKTIVPLKHLDVSLLQDQLQIQHMSKLKFIGIEGTVGDIMLHPSPEKFLEIFQHIECVELTTNGSVRTPEFYCDLAKHKNLRIVFSIDGLKDTNHLYRQGANFEKIMKNAKAFIDAGGWAQWKFIAFKHNQHQIHEAEQRSKQMGFKKFELRVSDRNWYNGKNFPVYNNGVYQYDLEPADLLQGSPLASDTRKLPKKLSEKAYNSIVCPRSLDREMYITREGYVIPCCMISDDLWLPNSKNKMFLKKLLPNLNEISLRFKTFKEILETKFYTDYLPESLMKRPMPICVQYCSK